MLSVTASEGEREREGTGVGRRMAEVGRRGKELSPSVGVGVITTSGLRDEGTSISDGTVKDGSGGDGVGVITTSTAVVSMTTNMVVLNGMSAVSASISMSTSGPALVVEEGREGGGGAGGREGRSTPLDGSDAGTTLVGRSKVMLLLRNSGLSIEMGVAVVEMDIVVSLEGAGVGVARGKGTEVSPEKLVKPVPSVEEIDGLGPVRRV